MLSCCKLKPNFTPIIPCVPQEVSVGYDESTEELVVGSAPADIHYVVTDGTNTSPPIIADGSPVNPNIWLDGTLLPWRVLYTDNCGNPFDIEILAPADCDNPPVIQGVTIRFDPSVHNNESPKAFGDVLDMITVGSAAVSPSTLRFCSPASDGWSLLSTAPGETPSLLFYTAVHNADGSVDDSSVDVCVDDINGCTGTATFTCIGVPATSPCGNAPPSTELLIVNHPDHSYDHRVGVYRFQINSTTASGWTSCLRVEDEGGAVVYEGADLDFNKLQWAQANGAYRNDHPANSGFIPEDDSVFPVVAFGTPQTLVARHVAKKDGCPTVVGTATLDLCPKQEAWTFDQTGKSVPANPKLEPNSGYVGSHVWSNPDTYDVGGPVYSSAVTITPDTRPGPPDGTIWCAKTHKIEINGVPPNVTSFSELLQNSNRYDCPFDVYENITMDCLGTISHTVGDGMDVMDFIDSVTDNALIRSAGDEQGAEVEGEWYWFQRPAITDQSECPCIYSGKLTVSADDSNPLGGDRAEVDVKQVHTF